LETKNNSERSSKDFGEQHFQQSGSWNNPATPTTKNLYTMCKGFFIFRTIKLVCKILKQKKSKINLNTFFFKLIFKNKHSAFIIFNFVFF
jgi:hypothetical protein